MTSRSLAGRTRRVGVGCTASSIVARGLGVMLTVCFVLASIASREQVFAEGGLSVPIGPAGSGASSILVQAPSQPNTIYAATSDSGIFRSTDGGSSWTHASNGLPLYPLDAFAFPYMLAVDPRNPLVVYVALDALGYNDPNGGVYKSVDGGDHWYQSLQEATSAIAIDPRNADIVYAGSFYRTGGISTPVLTMPEIFKSSDRGATWVKVYSDPDAGFISTIAPIPTNPTTLYVLNADQLMKSTDAGTTWQTSTLSVPSSVSNGSLIIDPTTPTTLYVGLAHGIAKSTDGGKSWKTITTGLPVDASQQVTPVSKLVFAPRTPHTLYAATDFGVYTSSDSGQSWRNSGTGLETMHVQALLATQTALYAGTAEGTYTSTDNGVTWVRSVHGFADSHITTLLFDAATPATVYAGTQQGLFVSNDSGVHWTSASTGILTQTVAALVQAPAPTYTLYALVNKNSFPIATKLYTSSDGGMNWTFVSEVPEYVDPRSLALNLATPTTLYTISQDQDVYKSVDSGVSWKAVHRGGFVITVDPAAPDTIFSGGQGPELYKSTDGGTTWITTTQGLDTDYHTFGINTLLVDSQHSDTVYAGTTKGIYISHDGGTSWQTSNAGLTPTPFITTLIQDPSTSTLYVSVQGGDIFKSTNSGASWVAIGSGVNSSSVRSLAINPFAATHLYAGTVSNGVFDIHLIDRPYSISLPIVVQT